MTMKSRRLSESSTICKCTLTLFVMAAAAIAPAAQTGATLSANERALVSYIDAHNDAGLALLERVVNINSGTENLAGVRAVGDIFKDEFSALGFQTRWVDGGSWHRAGH